MPEIIPDELYPNILKQLNKRSEEPDAVPASLTINFPYGLYRNIGSAFDSFMTGTKGLLIWTCTDGMFQGGIICDGAEKTFDLELWAKEHGESVMPDAATDFDGYVEWSPSASRSLTGFRPGCVSRRRRFRSKGLIMVHNSSLSIGFAIARPPWSDRY